MRSETYLRVREAYEAGELDVLGGQTRLAEELGVTRQAINTNLKRVKRDLEDGVRRAVLDRITAETRIHVELDIDGTGLAEVATGVGFYDHVLEAFAKHGRFDLELRCDGDLHVDEHHTMEDCALALGAAVDEALGDRSGLVRMGDATVPLDETLVQAVIDCSGRPYAAIDLDWGGERIGQAPTEMLGHALQSFSQGARCALHVRQLAGANDHHIAEAAFKALGRALDAATRRDPRIAGEVPSTKGTLTA
ncbi:MAG: imidazoleglycerol-phosphate dehydratase HisB [Chloroflexi bacterium]|nr:imidazoleglycerol-phosphate dehydratase HisB [Chloroflexota bacterium]